MSGVAKDDPIPGSGADTTVSAVGDAEAGHVETPVAAAPAAPAEADPKPNRRGAPFLRVVTGDAATDFVPELPPEEPAPAPEVLPNQRIGAAIRSKRETLGYSLEQVSKDTRVHLSHLRAIEEMTPNLLGAPVYAKGYIRAYARYLGLDEMSTLERYLRECAILKDPEKQEIAPPTTGRKLPSAAPVLGFLIIALIGAAGYFLINNTGGGDKTGAAAAPATGPGSQAQDGTSAEAAVAPAPVQQLRVVALRRSTLEVRSADGTKYLHRPLEPGESYTVRTGAGWTVSAPEDGSAFEWRLGDKSLGLLGPDATPLNAQSVDIAATRPPIEAALPPAPALTDAEKLAATAPAAIGTPGAGVAPAPLKPKRPKPVTPPPAASAAQETAPPVANAAPPPVQAPAAPATPSQDPALLAYPNQ